jgi:aconitate decarboxylase
VDDPVVDKIVAHIARVASGGAPEAAGQAKIFTADCLAVGIAGAGAPWRREVLDMAAASGGHAEATVWGSGEKLPLAAAAMVNGYQKCTRSNSIACMRARWCTRCRRSCRA